MTSFVKNLKRYIEVYNNHTEEILVRIKIDIDLKTIKENICIDPDDLNVLGVYSLNNNELEKFGIVNYDESELSFFLTSEA